jgi:hypothetical protein
MVPIQAGRDRPTLTVRRIRHNGLVASITPPACPLNLEPPNLDLLVVVSLDRTMLDPLTHPSRAFDVLKAAGVVEPTPMDVLRRALSAVVDSFGPSDQFGLVLGGGVGDDGEPLSPKKAAVNGPLGTGKLLFMNQGHKDWAHEAIETMEPSADDDGIDIVDLINRFRPAFDMSPRVRPVRSVFFITNRSFPKGSVAYLWRGVELTIAVTARRCSRSSPPRSRILPGRSRCIPLASVPMSTPACCPMSPTLVGARTSTSTWQARS